MENKKRTELDFSKHILTHRVYTCFEPNSNDINVWTLQLPQSSVHKFVFTNANGKMTVSGDYGTWVFEREFHPTSEGTVYDDYWIGKLINKNLSYDRDETIKELQYALDEGLEDYGYEGNELKRLKKIYTELLTYTDDELEYKYKAFREADASDIPYVESIHPRINYILDAFCEMCNRYKEIK